MGFMKELGTAFRLALVLGLLFGPTVVWGEVQMKSRDGQSRLANRMSQAKSRVAMSLSATPSPPEIAAASVAGS